MPTPLRDPILDLRGLRCPFPVLRTRKALKALAPGASVTVLTDDPLASIDIPHYLRTSGDCLERHERDGAAAIFLIRRGSGGATSSNSETT